MTKESPIRESEKPRQADFFSICEKCNVDCCRDARPPVTFNRRTIIEQYLRKKSIKTENIFEKTSYTFIKEDADCYCAFFDKETKKCKIHQVKPETCVSGPITFDINSKTGKIEWFLKFEKICSLAGVLYRDREALRRHMETAKRELLVLVRDLDADALNAILKIDEPETFKIGENELDRSVLEKIKIHS